MPYKFLSYYSTLLILLNGDIEPGEKEPLTHIPSLTLIFSF